jgi:hypothetical protein
LRKNQTAQLTNKTHFKASVFNNPTKSSLQKSSDSLIMRKVDVMGMPVARLELLAPRTLGVDSDLPTPPRVDLVAPLEEQACSEEVRRVHHLVRHNLRKLEVLDQLQVRVEGSLAVLQSLLRQAYLVHQQLSPLGLISLGLVGDLGQTHLQPVGLARPTLLVGRCLGTLPQTSLSALERRSLQRQVLHLVLLTLPQLVLGVVGDFSATRPSKRTPASVSSQQLLVTRLVDLDLQLNKLAHLCLAVQPASQNPQRQDYLALLQQLLARLVASLGTHSKQLQATIHLAALRPLKAADFLVLSLQQQADYSVIIRKTKELQHQAYLVALAIRRLNLRLNSKAPEGCLVI